MNLLLDTQVLLWWLLDDRRLGPSTREAIADPKHLVYVSAASAWEIAIKAALGKLDVPRDASRWLPAELSRGRFVELPVTVRHALGVERLPRHHDDPFDRLLVAQAGLEDLTLATADTLLSKYNVSILRAQS